MRAAASLFGKHGVVARRYRSWGMLVPCYSLGGVRLDGLEHRTLTVWLAVVTAALLPLLPMPSLPLMLLLVACVLLTFTLPLSGAPFSLVVGMLCHVVELLMAPFVVTSLANPMFGVRTPAAEAYLQMLSLYVAASGTGYMSAFAVASEEQV